MASESSTDLRLAALYDVDNPDGPDHDYFRNRADLIDARTIVDLGCGTGILTVTLAGDGRTVIGIDPDDGMLTVARKRTGNENVEWKLGDSRQIGDANADLILMTGNVAQHIGRDGWLRTLGDAATGLRHGGLLTFESRNPTTEAWKTWSAQDGLRTTRDTPFGPLTEWLEVGDIDQNGTLVLTFHNHWRESDDRVIVQLPLTFRTLEQITQDLTAVGLTVIEVEGGWSGEPFGATSPLMVIVAAKT